jgi:succinate dehydrogenase flavin-adding protein (antitoxin of CptAB toxin-antitoxin module)
MLELDLVLQRFLSTLRDDDAPMLAALLDLPDNDLWDIVTGRSDYYDRRYQATVERLRAA